MFIRTSFPVAVDLRVKEVSEAAPTVDWERAGVTSTGAEEAPPRPPGRLGRRGIRCKRFQVRGKYQIVCR